jgi:hypothetical protein
MSNGSFTLIFWFYWLNIWYQDRRPLTAADLHEPPPPTDLTQKPIRDMEEEPLGIRAGSSAKIDQLVHLLNLTPPTEKCLVFSQFTSFLDKVMFGAGDSDCKANDI